MAVVGLAVNLASALILGSGHGHAHDHAHEHDHDHAHDHDHGHSPEHAHSDLNLRSAYVRAARRRADVDLRDRARSSPASSSAGPGWTRCAASAARSSSCAGPSGSHGTPPQCCSTPECDAGIVERVRARPEETSGDRVTDLHVWRVGPGRFAAVASLVSDEPLAPEHYRSAWRTSPRSRT